MRNAVSASDGKARGRERHETRDSTAERERLTCAQRFVQQNNKERNLTKIRYVFLLFFMCIKS